MIREDIESLLKRAEQHIKWGTSFCVDAKILATLCKITLASENLLETLNFVDKKLEYIEGGYAYECSESIRKCKEKFKEKTR